jgi:tRNA-specific 2-thiouridylase
VGKVHLPTFLAQKLKAKKGHIIEIPAYNEFRKWNDGLPSDDITDKELKMMVLPHDLDPSAGKIIGEHNGAHFFTIGQRKGINIGGYREPLFVIGTDIENNILYVGEGQSHPGLYRKGIFIDNDETNWIRNDLKPAPGLNREYATRIRYRQSLQVAKLFMRSSGIYIIFNKLQRGVAPGQFAAWYDKDEVIGSGVIQ